MSFPAASTLPPCCEAAADAPLAQRLYAAYNRGGPADKAGLNYQGLPCPLWHDLPESVREKWESVAAEAQREDLLPQAERLEEKIAMTAQLVGRGPVGLALNAAKTCVGAAIGWLLRAQKDGGAVGSG